MKQNYKDYTKEDQEVWNLLFKRQRENLSDKASKVYLDCLDKMAPCLNNKSIPDFKKINSFFAIHTEWEIHVVPGLIPVDEFFELLSRKKFCSSTWLRNMEQIDYLEEPDMFHDIFGHIPLLLDPIFSKFAQAFGKLGLQFSGNEQIQLQLQRIYWFTIEFGLMRENGELKIYGAGIASSYGESKHIFDEEVQTMPYNIKEVIETDFDTDHIQNQYFIIDSFEELFLSLEIFRSQIALQLAKAS